MSSTNRGSKRSTHDYYVTPVDAIKHFIRCLATDVANNSVLTSCPQTAFHWAEEDKLRKFDVFDPSAGGDEVNGCSYSMALDALPFESRYTGWDIRDNCPALVQVRDYLQPHDPVNAHITMTNPPFSIAREFIQRALADTIAGGLVIMLLRLNYFGSGKRFEFWKNYMPQVCYVHSERMSFLPKEHCKAAAAWMAENELKPGGKDSIEYMHAVWQVGNYPRFTKLRVI